MTVWRRPTRCGRKARLRRVTFVAWARAVETGSPWENGFAESFFSRLRDELLNCEEFENLPEARWFARRRRKEEHNKERPHSSLDYQTLAEFAAGCAAASAPAAPPLQQQHSRAEEALPVTQPVLP